MACLSDGTPTLRSVTGSAHYLGETTNTGVNVYVGVHANQAYGALPANFPAVTYDTGTPRLMMLAMSGMEEVSDGWRTTQDVEQGMVLLPPHVSGRYYNTPISAYSCNARSFTLVAATLYGLPFLVSQSSRAYDRIAIEVTTLKALSHVQLGIYADSGGAPGALVVDAGNVSSASTGGKEINIAQTLARGWYWLAAVSDDAPTLRGFSNLISQAFFPWLGFSSGGNFTNHAGVSVARPYGALPNPFTAGSVLSDGPRILLRAT